MAKLILENISKKFYSDVIFENLNLETDENEFVVLLGPSGCGKTTLLKIIAGLEQPDSGKIIINGVNVTELPPQQRNIAMIFQNFPVYPHLNVFNNLATPLKIKGISQNEIFKKVNQIADSLTITQLLKRDTRNLSGGEAQRVAIGKALLKETNIFLLDEPLSDLDSEVKSTIKDLIKEIHKTQNNLVIYVTHDQTEAMSLADRIAIVHNRNILQFDKAEIIYHKPISKFVAEFVGAIKCNVIKCKILKLNGELFLKTAYGKIRIKQNYSNYENIDSCEIMIRPEAIKLTTNTIASEILEAEISNIEFLGNNYLIKLDYDHLRILTNFLTYPYPKNKLKFFIDENDIILFKE